MFNKIKESLRPFLPAGHMAGRPPRPAPEPPPRPRMVPDPEFPPVTLTYTGTEWQIKEEPVLELWIQSK